MSDHEVADYLLANPEFFAQYAELLATIRFANPHGKAVISLQERQMEILCDKNKHLERRLAELVRYGHENDSLSVKLGRWTARVIAEYDPYALTRMIVGGIADVFDVPQAALRVWDVADTYAQADFARQVGEEVRLFTNSLSTPYCGREYRLRCRAVARARGHRADHECSPEGTEATPAGDAARPRRSRCERRSPTPMRPRSACSCSASPIRAVSTTRWSPTSSSRSRRLRARRSRACCRTNPSHAMTDDPVAAICRT